MSEKPLRSVSQLKQYEKCPQSYKLARIDKVWQRPAAWLPQGTAVHEVLEWVEKCFAEHGKLPPIEEALAMFDKAYARDVNAFTDITPNFEWWAQSGPYRGKEDVERRWAIGREQIEKFYGWRKVDGQTIWTTPGRGVCATEAWRDESCKECEQPKPAIELSFNIELDGILVRGFIDAVVVVDGELRVRDYKTGNTPGDDFQLGVYSLAVAKKYGVEQPRLGDYYMAGKKGKKAVVTKPYDLTEWTEEKVTAAFRGLEDNIQAGNFDPDPEPDKCRFCDVSYSCEFFEG
jgi:putative RecB family exonuclease